MSQQSHAEEIENKRKVIAHKVSSSKEDCKEISSDNKDRENLSLIVKKFWKFLNGSKDKILKIFKESRKQQQYLHMLRMQEVRPHKIRLSYLPKKITC